MLSVNGQFIVRIESFCDHHPRKGKKHIDTEHTITFILHPVTTIRARIPSDQRSVDLLLDYKYYCFLY